MRKLSEQYKKIGILSLEISIIAQFFILAILIPSLPQFISYNKWVNDFVVFILSSSALYLILAKLPLYLFEKFLWRFFNKSIDYHGVWNYKHKCKGLSEKDMKLLKKDAFEEKQNIIKLLENNHGKVFFNQSVFGISIQKGTGSLGKSDDSPRTSWKGISANYNDEGNFVVHFESTLDNNVFQGIDTLTVEKWDQNGKPLVLSGNTILVPINTNHVFRGEITYFR